LVDIEIYSPTGARVYQKAFDNQTFAAGQSKAFSLNWTVPRRPQIGTYTVKVGVFGTGWSTLYMWNDVAGQFVVTP